MLTIKPDALDRSHWWENAKCAGEDVNIYDLSDRSTMINRADLARKLCDGCPVVAHCAIDAALHEDVGVVRAGLWLSHKGPSMRKRLLAQADWAWNRRDERQAA